MLAICGLKEGCLRVRQKDSGVNQRYVLGGVGDPYAAAVSF
jgi:hypothetical protein